MSMPPRCGQVVKVGAVAIAPRASGPAIAGADDCPEDLDRDGTSGPGILVHPVIFPIVRRRELAKKIILHGRTAGVEAIAKR